MLVLKRSLHDDVIITATSGEQIIVSVVEVRGSNDVRLGFSAPRSVNIARREAIKQDGPKNWAERNHVKE